MTFSTTTHFLKMFGMSNLSDFARFTKKYKLDENRQIVIDEIIEEKGEAPIPSEQEEEQKNDGAVVKVCLKEGMKINEVK